MRVVGGARFDTEKRMPLLEIAELESIACSIKEGVFGEGGCAGGGISGHGLIQEAPERENDR